MTPDLVGVQIVDQSDLLVAGADGGAELHRVQFSLELDGWLVSELT